MTAGNNTISNVISPHCTLDIPATAPQSLPHDTPEIQHGDSGDKRDSMFDISVGDWVAAEYDRQGYVGEVIDIGDNDYLINFLEKSGKLEG